MVSYQTSADGEAAKGNPPQQPAAASSWPDDAADSVWEDAAPNRNNAQETTQSGNVPVSLVPGGPSRPAPHIHDHQDVSNVWADNENQSQQSCDVDHVPSVLRPGGRNNQTNPFRAKESQTSNNPAPPTDAFANMNIGGTATNNPWGSAMTAQNTGTNNEPKEPPTVPSNMDNGPWSAPEAVVANPSAAAKSLNIPTQPEEQSAWADGDRSTENKKESTSIASPVSDKLFDAFEQDQGVWDDLGASGKEHGKAAEESDDQDDWNMINSETSSITSENAEKPTKQKAPGPAKTLLDEPAVEPDSATSASAHHQQPAQVPTQATTSKPQNEAPQLKLIETEDPETREKPALPPRQSEAARWAPTRQPVDGKTETYQIKNIRWHDPDSSQNPRTSPILMQNENGPCPLVALVNALSLTTPPDVSDTTLVQVLRSRERVSLNLVLDAVFDELMSPRRTSSEDALPDITELYEFLQSLHTGMNVNPRYIPTKQMVEAYKRSSLTHLPADEREGLMPGTFENSLEMKLYATFSIPLIHGWLPAKSEPVYEAFERQAASYEDVQNLLFREEELERKLSDPDGALTDPEQQLYQDIITIKIFMETSATQLTHFGIDVISKAIRPGTFAIFFRNDHFSTLYCHPRTKQLLTLVTDAGYSSHDEVVWESLADINGERTELYSGDFRVVSGSGSAGPSSSSAYSADQGGSGWTTVQGRRGKDRQQEPELERPLSANHEQEDRDLALALQLQEEEEQKQRDEQERRNRESRLSEQFIEQQGRRPEPVNRGPRRQSAGSGGQIAPARRSSSSVNVSVQSPRRTSEQRPSPQPQTQSQTIRPLIPPRRQAVNRTTESGEDAPPPSYEQAAHDTRVNPTTGRPNAGADRPQSQANPGIPSGYRPAARPNPVIQPPVGSTHYDRERERVRDCVVM